MSRLTTRPLVPAFIAWIASLILIFVIVNFFVMPWAAGKYRPVATVPHLVGLDTLAAADTLRTRGLSLMIDSVGDHSRTVPAGHVLLQTPDSGAVVKQGRRVWVTLSLGREKVVRPGGARH